MAEGERSSQDVPAEVLALACERQEARLRRDWATSDPLRDRIAALGWQVADTPEGPVLTRIPTAQ